MIKVIYGNNVNRSTAIVDPGMTIQEFVNTHDGCVMENGRGILHLNGAPINNYMDKTFTDLGVTDRAFLINVTKADNA